MAYESPIKVDGYDPNAPRNYGSKEADDQIEYDRQNRESFGNGMYDGDGNVRSKFNEGADEIQENWEKNRPYQNPGSADYGGFQGGVEYYGKLAAEGGAKNDQQQAGNQAAMETAYQNAIGGRNAVHREDGVLTSRASETRNQQMDALDLTRQAAMGNAPSETEAQTRLGMNEVMATQSGQMGGARGLAGLSGAQAQGAAMSGQSAGNLAAAGGLARSKEISDAIGMYGTRAGTVRDQDLSRLGQNTQNSMFNAKLNDDWQMGNAQLLAQQAQLGNAQSGTDLAWMGEQYRGMDKQFQDDQEMAASEAGADADAAGASIAAVREEKDNKRQMINNGVTGGLSAVGSLAGPLGTVAGAGLGAGFAAATKDWEW